MSGRRRLRIAVLACVVVLSAVACKPTPAPGGSSAPKISGRAAVGSTLRVSGGKWLFTPTTYRYALAFVRGQEERLPAGRC